MLTFLDPQYLALFLLIPPLLFLWWKRQPIVGHSKLNIQANLPSFSFVSRLPALFLVLALSATTLALAHPAVPYTTFEGGIVARDIIVAVDISSSMDGGVEDSFGLPCIGRCGSSSSSQMRKIDLARSSVHEFVRLRQGDRIALIVFNDKTYYHWPLTQDKTVILSKVEMLTNTTGGTNFDGPSSSSPSVGPLQAAIDHFEEYGQSTSKVIVLVTDGEASISDRRMVELAKQFEALQVKLYVIGVGSEWTSNSPGTMPLRHLVNSVGGVTIAAGSASQLRQAMLSINKLESSQVKTLETLRHTDFYWPFVVAAIFFWLLFLLFNAATRRTS